MLCVRLPFRMHHRFVPFLVVCLAAALPASAQVFPSFPVRAEEPPPPSSSAQPAASEQDQSEAEYRMRREELIRQLQVLEEQARRERERADLLRQEEQHRLALAEAAAAAAQAPARASASFASGMVRSGVRVFVLGNLSRAFDWTADPVVYGVRDGLFPHLGPSAPGESDLHLGRGTYVGNSFMSTAPDDYEPNSLWEEEAAAGHPLAIEAGIEKVASSGVSLGFRWSWHHSSRPIQLVGRPHGPRPADPGSREHHFKPMDGLRREPGGSWHFLSPRLGFVVPFSDSLELSLSAGPGVAVVNTRFHADWPLCTDPPTPRQPFAAPDPYRSTSGVVLCSPALPDGDDLLTFVPLADERLWNPRAYSGLVPMMTDRKWVFGIASSFDVTWWFRENAGLTGGFSLHWAENGEKGESGHFGLRPAPMVHAGIRFGI